MPNEPQPQGACELQGRQIEAPGLLALVLPVDTHQWVLADNSRPQLDQQLHLIGASPSGPGTGLHGTPPVARHRELVSQQS
jgi:hypothetical protein